MAVPKKRKSYSKTRKGRSHHKLETPEFVEDKQTGEFVRPHHVCLKTGMYAGKQVIDPDDL